MDRDVLEQMALEFVNTQWYIDHEQCSDPMDDLEWWHGYCLKWKVENPLQSTERDQSEILLRLKEVRCFFDQAFQEITAAHVLKSETITVLNMYLSNSTYRYQLESQGDQYSINEVMMADVVGALIGKVAHSFSLLISNNKLKRIKGCNNPECHWFFYDTTKNGSRKWCDDKCASKMKVRRFRERQKKKAHKETQ